MILPECNHPQSELRCRILRNQTRSIQRQCRTCGNATSNALKQSDYTVEQLAALPMWDDGLQQKYWNEQTAERQRAVSEMDAQNQQAKIEYTQKYRDYLQSTDWSWKRTAVLDRDNHWCQGCLHDKATQVHHLTYAHIFDELLFELTSLCDKCHKKCHRITVP